MDFIFKSEGDRKKSGPMKQKINEHINAETERLYPIEKKKKRKKEKKTKHKKKWFTPASASEKRIV